MRLSDLLSWVPGFQKEEEKVKDFSFDQVPESLEQVTRSLEFFMGRNHIINGVEDLGEHPEGRIYQIDGKAQAILGGHPFLYAILKLEGAYQGTDLVNVTAYHDDVKMLTLDYTPVDRLDLVIWVDKTFAHEGDKHIEVLPETARKLVWSKAKKIDGEMVEDYERGRMYQVDCSLSEEAVKRFDNLDSLTKFRTVYEPTLRCFVNQKEDGYVGTPIFFQNQLMDQSLN